jgi:hypothetical protein
LRVTGVVKQAGVESHFGLRELPASSCNDFNRRQDPAPNHEAEC